MNTVRTSGKRDVTNQRENFVHYYFKLVKRTRPVPLACNILYDYDTKKRDEYLLKYKFGLATLFPENLHDIFTVLTDEKLNGWTAATNKRR